MVIKINNLNEIKDDEMINSNEEDVDEQLMDINKVCNPEYLKETKAMWEGALKLRRSWESAVGRELQLINCRNELNNYLHEY